MTEDILRSLVGREVAVHTVAGQSGYKDEGIVRAVDHRVLVLETKKGTLILLLHGIRLIKPV